MIEASPAPARQPVAVPDKSDDPIRVMVVDDSAVIRGLITRMLNAESDIEVTASMSNGRFAVNKIARQQFDVVILDIEMPVMDGLTALPLLIKEDPEIKIIMASTLTAKNAEVSLKALQAGAADYVPKPSSTREISGSDGGDFRRDLVAKVKSLGGVRKTRPGRVVRDRATRPAAFVSAVPTSKDIVLRKAGIHRPNIVAIGSSTGGPQALFTFLKDLKPTLKVPVVITQHMPPTFTTILAEHISRQTEWKCEEGKDGDVLKRGYIHLAPGGYHMGVVQKGPQQIIQLNQDPPESFCRPAVDPMLRSVVKVFGPRVLTIILTGMGADGLKGGKQVVEAGGTVIAQDEESSVVWGMPGAVATNGLCSAVLPLKDLAKYAMDFLG
jgi:two-component system chemotaxis response regulator CheB